MKSLNALPPVVLAFVVCRRNVEQPHFPRHRTRPILWPWRKAPQAATIRQSIRKKTRPSRPAPRRRGRMCRRSTRCAGGLLNPAIGQGRAGVGAQTGFSLTPPRPQGGGDTSGPASSAAPDNSWDRRADFANAHRARAGRRAALARRRSRAMSAKRRCRPANSIPIWRARWASTSRMRTADCARPRRDQLLAMSRRRDALRARPRTRRARRVRRPRQPAIARQIAARGPRRISRSAVDAAPAAAAG